jgi:hypothetical protein
MLKVSNLINTPNQPSSADAEWHPPLTPCIPADLSVRCTWLSLLLNLTMYTTFQLCVFAFLIFLGCTGIFFPALMHVRLFILILLSEPFRERCAVGRYMDRRDTGAAAGRLVAVPVRRNANRSHHRVNGDIDGRGYSAALLRQVRNERRSNNEQGRNPRDLMQTVYQTRDVTRPQRDAGLHPIIPNQKFDNLQFPNQRVIYGQHDSKLTPPTLPQTGFSTTGNQRVHDSNVQKIQPQQFRSGVDNQQNHNMAQVMTHPVPQKIITRTTVVEEFIIPEAFTEQNLNFQIQSVPTSHSVITTA